MSLESQASPPARKSSAVKGVGKGSGVGGIGGLGSSSSPKTFQCTGYPGCNMVFTRSEHLARHESRYDNMIQHTQTHSDRTKRDSLAAVAAVSAAGVIGSGPHSRSSSVQSTPLLPGRPRGGSSPVVFGLSWDEHHRRTQNNSPASPYNASPAFAHQHQQQHHHPYSPHYQQQHQQQPHHPPHHPIQWSLPSGAPAGSSPALSAQYYSHHHGAESHPYLPGHQGPSTPVVRTLKANSRSLPHLQARASPIVSSTSSTAESPSVGLQQSMSAIEIEELKRRKSEVLLPSSFSGVRAASVSTGVGQGIGLGMSPFTPTTSHPQSLPQVENLTVGEQELLNEHRRSAQAMFYKMNSGREGSMDVRRTPEYSESRPVSQQQQQQHHHQQHQQPLGTSTSLRSGSTAPTLPHVPQLSTQEKGRLLEHRKSTPELMYDSRMKRSSNDPTDMVVQPLPSRDSRSGMQWFSQVSTPLTSSPRSSLTPREGGGPSSVKGHGPSSSSAGHSSGESSMILPPIMGPYEEPQRDRQGRIRSHSSHIHPLSRPTTQFDSSNLAQFSSSEEAKDHRQQFDAASALSPRLERCWEEQYFPIRKRHVVEAIERMESREFLGLKCQVAEHHANEQFRNPEFLGNMTAILCVIRAPHMAWKGGEKRQGSQGSVASASEQGSSFAGSRRTSRDMEVDESERASLANAATIAGVTKAMTTTTTIIKTEEGSASSAKEPESMDVDDGNRISSKDVIVQPCRFALDIDVDSYSRDPEPDLHGFENLTINSLFPTRSFVAGFEDATIAALGDNTSEKNRYVSSHGYPSNARLGRFYLPERSYRTPESLATQPDPNDRWVSCRFEEYHGVSIWVLESVLDKYHEISRRHKMALTLIGATVHHWEAVYSREDWEIHSGEQYEIKAKESVLYPEMIHQVWKDMYHQHHQRAQQNQQQQQQHQRPSMPQVATYEEYQRNLMQSSADPRRESYHQQQLSQQQQQHQHQHQAPRDRSSGPHYSYSDYRQQQQNLHREDFSSAPSSPQSPRHDDFQDEISHQHHHQQQQQQRQGPTANMHRRISIAELCNPMQSLATERAQRREETASKRTSM
ncbi:hypothetical protein BGX24_000043 [Mortierella sp. AD032]|nr:hypothetical protein BGX24_000043 [Mortierella sp. AD032]